MTYFVFDTEMEAETAQQQIVNNALAAVKSFSPEAVTDEGLIGRNAKTGDLSPASTLTNRWADPRETIDGKWAIPVPTDEDLQSPHGSVPASVATTGLTAETAISPTWVVVD